MKSLYRTCSSIFLAAALLVLAAAVSAQTQKHKNEPPRNRVLLKVQPLNINPGRWETTTHYNMNGNPSTGTDSTCVTKEDLQKAEFEVSGDCTETILTSTSTVAKGNYSCNIDGNQAKGTIEIDVVDQQHVKGTTHGTAAGPAGNMSIDTTFTSKWVGATCESGQ